MLDARRLQCFNDGQFDVCAALDVIEHFTKQEGVLFLQELERVAAKRVVVFTPNGFLPQASRTKDDHQEHLSGWRPGEFEALGYQVIGIGGLKILRTSSHELRFQPSALWALISWLSQQLWCRSHPGSAAAVLCWRDKHCRAKS